MGLGRHVRQSSFDTTATAPTAGRVSCLRVTPIAAAVGAIGSRCIDMQAATAKMKPLRLNLLSTRKDRNYG